VADDGARAETRCGLPHVKVRGNPVNVRPAAESMSRSRATCLELAVFSDEYCFVLRALPESANGGGRIEFEFNESVSIRLLHSASSFAEVPSAGVYTPRI
jgi:hypothetical protein